MDKIADAFSLIRNGANIKQGLDDSGYPITRIETISNRTVDRDKIGYAGITDITKYSDYVLQDGDILMSHINSETHLGKVARYEKYEGETIIHGMNLLCLRPNKNLVDSRYAFYYLSSEAFLHQIPRITKKSVNQASFNVAALKELTFPISSMEVQQLVADILDKANELIALRKEQLAKLDELIKARFVEMFGDPVQNSLKWVTKSLLEMGYCKNGVNFHSGDSGIEIHCLGVGDFKDYSVVDGTDYLPTISLSEEPPEESMLQDGDIVFVRSNGNKALVGRCLVVYPHNTPTTYSGFCIRYRLTSDEVNTSYLLRVLKADSMRKKMIGRGANIQNLNQKTLATLNIPIPPMELQEQFAEFVNQTDKSKIAVQKALDEAQLLFDSLMQKYFG